MLSLQHVMRSALCLWCTTVSFAELWVYMYNNIDPVPLLRCSGGGDDWSLVFIYFLKIFKSSIFIHILFLCVWVFYSVPSCLHKEIFYFFPFFLVPLAFSPLFLKLAYHQESRYIYLFIHIVISYAIYSIMLCILSLLYCNMWWIQVGWIFRWTIRHFIWRLELGELLPTDGGRRVHTHTHTYVI